MADWYVSGPAWTAIAQFATGSYTVGQIVRPLTAPAFAAQYAFRCTTAGSASAEPSWSSAGNNNSTVTAPGGAVFTNVSGQGAYGWNAAAGNLYCISNGPTTARASAGDRFFLSSDHSETSGNGPGQLLASVAWGLNQVISVNRAGSVPPAAGDALSGATIVYNGTSQLAVEAMCNTYWQGITFNLGGSGNALWFDNNGPKAHYLRNCAIIFSTSNTTAFIGTNAYTGALVLDNTTVQFNAAGQRFQTCSLDIRWINTPSALSGTVPTNLFNTGSINGSPFAVMLRGIDLSSLTTTLYAYNQNSFGKVLLDSCRIASGLTRLGTPGTSQGPADEIELVNCYDGTNILSERHTPAGDLTTNRSVTLVGGAQDDVGLFSHQMASSIRADMLAMTLDSFWLDVEQSAVGTSHTATVELVAPGAPLNNTDISLMLEYQGTSGSSLATLASTLANALTTSAALPTSTATWNNMPAAAANTFDPTFNTAAFTLSGGNLTAALVGSGHQNVRTLYSFTAGKVYFEATALTLGSAGCGPGVGNTIAGTGFLGGSANGFQYISSGAVYTNNAVLATIATYVVNNVICVAVDIGNRKLWYRVNAGNWNNTAGNDPGSNVGGYDLTALLANNGTVYPAFDGWQSGDSFRFNLGATAFAQTVPTGFSGIQTGPTPVAQHLQAAFTPQTAGRLRGLVRLGRPSTTVWVNPQIVVT